MKIKEVTGNLYQFIGLGLINALARSGRYELQSDVRYGVKNRNTLDYYRCEHEEPRPTILFFYGGGWQSGEKKNYRFVADTLTYYGYNVVIPNYRLYPLVRFAQIQEDSVNATQWVLENVSADQPIYIMGHSAGAQLGALLCLNKSLLDSSQGLDQRIGGFIGLAGPYDFYPFTEDEHWDLFSPEESYTDSQAVNFVRVDCPPMYLLHGENDNRIRRGHSKSLMEKVQAVGGRATREVYSDTGHVDIILQLARIYRRSSPVVRDIVRFLSDHSASRLTKAGHQESTDGLDELPSN